MVWRDRRPIWRRERLLQRRIDSRSGLFPRAPNHQINNNSYHLRKFTGHRTDSPARHLTIAEENQEEDYNRYRYKRENSTLSIENNFCKKLHLKDLCFLKNSHSGIIFRGCNSRKDFCAFCLYLDAVVVVNLRAVANHKKEKKTELLVDSVERLLPIEGNSIGPKFS